jgi:hypothetical protein
LGGTIYFLLTGRDPLPLSVSRPKTFRQDTPESLDEIVARLSSFEPEERIQTAQEVIDELRRVKSELSSGAVVSAGDSA